tara:strand:+ start:1279 stop:1605 length:327 start_codon:yes stop_codon:yes gene_type:complete
MELIDNINSEARDHLANERTFLSWSRSSLTFLGISVALVEFKMLVSAVSFAIVGIIYTIFSLYRYYEVKNALLKKKYIINNLAIILITIFSVILILFAFIIIFYEKHY